MPQVPSGDLSARLLALESAVRSLQTSNGGLPVDPTPRVTALEGRATSLESRDTSLETRASALEARGGPGATVSAGDTSAYRINSVANAAGTTPWTTGVGPTVDLNVPDQARLLIRWAAQQEVYAGGSTVTAWGFVGYRITGPATTQAALATATDLQVPDSTRQLTLKDKGGASSVMAAHSELDVTAALAAGWYRLSLSYAHQYNATAVAGFAIAVNRLLAATIL